MLMGSSYVITGNGLTVTIRYVITDNGLVGVNFGYVTTGHEEQFLSVNVCFLIWRPGALGHLKSTA